MVTLQDLSNTWKVRLPYIVMSDMCDDTKNCIDNLCDFHGGCVKGSLFFYIYNYII